MLSLNTKAQSMVEYIVVLIFFLIVIIYLMFSYMQIIPGEVSQIREQKACSEAEILADALFNFEGNTSNWETSGDLNHLGFSTGNMSEINYTKFDNAVSRGYYNVSNETSFSTPFYITYSAYALNLTSDTIPEELPNDTNPRAFLVRESNALTLYAGSNSTAARLEITFFFPMVSVTLLNCSELESTDTNTTTDRDNGTEIKIDTSFSSFDLDCYNFSLSETPDLVYIKDLTLKNSSTAKNYPVYAGNHTIIERNFGSTGYVSPYENYCEIERKGLLINNGEKIPIYLNVIVW